MRKLHIKTSGSLSGERKMRCFVMDPVELMWFPISKRAARMLVERGYAEDITDDIKAGRVNLSRVNPKEAENP
jgi:hypothetical protein